MSTATTFGKATNDHDDLAAWLETRAESNFFVHPAWFDAISRCAPQCTPAFFAVSEAGCPQACLSMLCSEGRIAGLSYRALHGCTSMYTTWFGPVHRGDGAHCGDLARNMVERERPDLVSIDCLDPEDPGFGPLCRGFDEAGFATTRYRHFANWYEVIEATSFDNFLSSRTSVLRNTYQRKTRKLFREHQGWIALETEPDRIEPLLNAYETVYRMSWKVPEPHPHFVPAVARAASAAGALRLGVLYVDEVPVASQIWIVTNRVATIFKLAYDDRFKKLSVGTVLTGHMMRYVIEVDRVEHIDFGRGDEPYKAQWLTQYRERYGLLALNRRSLLGNVLRLRHAPPGIRTARRLVRRS